MLKKKFTETARKRRMIKVTALLLAGIRLSETGAGGKIRSALKEKTKTASFLHETTDGSIDHRGRIYR